jgi:hypothetical protein
MEPMENPLHGVDGAILGENQIHLRGKKPRGSNINHHQGTKTPRTAVIPWFKTKSFLGDLVSWWWELGVLKGFWLSGLDFFVFNSLE